MNSSTHELENAVVQEFDNYLIAMVSNRESGNLEKLISHDYLHLLDTYIEYGDSISLPSELKMSDEEILEKHLAHYYLPEKLKELGILHRDVYIEYSRAYIHQQQAELSDGQMEDFIRKSFEVLQQATDSFVERFEAFRRSIQSSPTEQKKIRNNLMLVESPWEVFKEQLRELQEQIRRAVQDKNDVAKMRSSIEEVKSFFAGIALKNQTLCDHFINGYSSLGESLTVKNVKSFSQRIDDLAELSQPLGNGEINYAAIENMQFPVSTVRANILTETGDLEIREFNLQKGFRKWMDYGIMPLWAKLCEQENAFKIKNQVRLANLINSLQLYAQSGLEDEKERILTACHELLEEAREFRKTSAAILENIETKLREDLSVTHFINGKDFMEIPLQSTFDFGQKTFLETGRNFLRKYLNLFFRWYERAGKKDSKPLFEVALSSIEQRLGNLEPDRYDSIFLNKNFMGDLFLVERKHESELVARIMDSWKKGFVKSLLVTGAPLCGKSTFIQQTANTYFKRNIVHLVPHSEAVVDGRKFNVSCDLEEALQYIKNHNLQSTKLAICIDNLELWKDQDHSIYDNVRALMQFTDNESDEFFLIIGASDILVQQLETRFGLLKHFTSQIDLSKATREEISKAVMTRHQATHRELVNEKGLIISEKRASHFIYGLARKYGYNLGSVLQAWTFHTIQQSEQEIMLTRNIQDFIDFFTPHEKIILKHLLLYRATSEFEIKKLVGNLYEENFKSSIKRLINSNILDRDINGKLSIKPMFINDIGKIIKQENQYIGGL